MTDQMITIATLPDSPEAFAAVQTGLATTPTGGAAMLLLAFLIYSEDTELGLACLAQAIHPKRLQAHGDTHRVSVADQQRLRERIAQRPEVARSYVQGATPANGYQLPAPPFTFSLKADPRADYTETVRLFVHSSGADSARPVQVREANGLWLADEWSSLTSGVRPAAD